MNYDPYLRISDNDLFGSPPGLQAIRQPPGLHAFSPAPYAASRAQTPSHPRAQPLPNRQHACNDMDDASHPTLSASTSSHRHQMEVEVKSQSPIDRDVMDELLRGSGTVPEHMETSHHMLPDPPTVPSKPSTARRMDDFEAEMRSKYQDILRENNALLERRSLREQEQQEIDQMQLKINQQQQKLHQKQHALDERAARDEKMQQYLDGALEQALQELARRRDLQKQEQHQAAHRTRTNPQQPHSAEQHKRKQRLAPSLHSNQSAPSQQRARYAQPATHAQQQPAQPKAQHQHREPNQAQPRRYSRTTSTSRFNQQLSSMAPQGNGGVRLQSAMSVAAKSSHQRAQPPKRQKSQPASNSRSGVKANTATGSVHSQLKRQRNRSWVSKSGVGAHIERAQAHRKGARSSNKYLNAVKMGSPRSATGTVAKRFGI